MKCLLWTRTARILALAAAVPLAGTLHAQAADGSQGSDGGLQTELSKDLNKKQFRQVHVSVQDGTVVLSGTVDRLSDKLDAEKRTHLRNRNDIRGFEDRIEVAGPVVEDAMLAAKLLQKLFYVREGYGTIAFNAFTVSVRNGVVTLGGVAFGPPDHDDAVAVVETFPGVKGLMDRVEVAPLSPNDNRIRLDEERAIYGFGPLNKYGLNPARPIRILVLNGNVTLVGVVDSQGDKELANIRANQVPGAFKVTNDLQVAGISQEPGAR